MASADALRYKEWFSRSNDPSEDERILKPLIHIDPITLAESNFFLNMIRAMNHWFKVPHNQLELAVLIAAINYNKETLTDDIQDKTEIRNKLPAAHLVYGVPHVMNAALYMIFIQVEKIAYEFPDPVEAIKVHIHYAMECLRGQWIEVEWRDHGTPPTLEQYRKNVFRKTGGPCMNGMMLLQHFSENKTDYVEYIELLSTFFQFHNDYINLTSKRYHETKGFAEDITEGKFNMPIIHGIWARPNDKRILDIMKQSTRSYELKKQCVDLLEEFGSFEFARKTINQLKDEIMAKTAALGGNPQMVRVIEEHLASWD